MASTVIELSDSDDYKDSIMLAIKRVQGGDHSSSTQSQPRLTVLQTIEERRAMETM